MLGLVLAAQLAAAEVRRLPSDYAHQGVAADAVSVYAIANSAIARISKVTGEQLAVWKGDPARYKHLNSCVVRKASLVCVVSNYPDTPMRSRVLWLDKATLKLQREHDLGHGAGSLTWLDWHQGSWWAGYANYDGKGGEPGRDHRETALVRYSASFIEQARWRFPEAVLARFAPRSSSGGVWGADGLLYVTGHDRSELYVLRVPVGGSELGLVATMLTPTGGQAIGWDGAEKRLLWSIDRARSELVASYVMPVPRPSAGAPEMEAHSLARAASGGAERGEAGTEMPVQ